MRKALDIALKDALIWSRDIAALGVLLGMPVVLILILGSALGGGGSEAGIPVAVVNLDEGVMAQAPGEPPASSRGAMVEMGDELTSSVRESERLADVFDVDTLRTEREASEKVSSGDLVAALIIPADFSERVNAGEPVSLRVLKDPGAEVSAGIWESVIRSYAARYSAVSVAVQAAFEAAAEHDPALLMTPQGQAELQQGIVDAVGHAGLEAVTMTESFDEDETRFRALDFFGVTMTAMFLTFGAMFGAFSTIRERREQTLSRMLASPTSGAAVTAGKMLGIFGLGLAQFAVLYVFTRFVFGVNWGDDVLATVIVAAAELVAVTGLAVLIAAFARTERGAGGLGPLIIQIQALIGGAFFTIAILPEWMQPVRYLSIIGWAIEGWQEVQLRGGGVPDVMVPVAALLAFGAAFYGIGAWRMGARA